MAKYKIAIDAGHGSNTPGKRTPPFTKAVDINGDKIIDIKKGEQYLEHYANVGVAELLYNKLLQRGYSVIRTGWNDTNGKDDPDEALSSRQNKIKKAKCDLSISIHFNAYGDGKKFNSVKGVSVYIHSLYPEDSSKFAEYVLKELQKGTSQTNRGIHSNRLSLCNCKTMETKASILCELAFMTNKYEAMELMANSTFWEECAEEIADGVDRYCNCHKTEKTTPSGIIELYHTVVRGDTLSKIAAANNTTVNELVKINKIKDPNMIRVGQQILITNYIRYQVQKGDTLSKISKKYLGSSGKYKLIMTFNNLTSTTIYTGQILKIPL